MTRRPKLLDLFSGQGGAAMGYHRAGFDVTGVDVVEQPRYPFRFVCADALEYVAAHGREYDVIHASPPCQAYSVLNIPLQNEYPELIEPVRDLLIRSGKIYVIENVVGAPLLTSIMLCGTMFNLKTFRHRLFESNILLFAPDHKTHTDNTVRHGGTFIQFTGTGGNYKRGDEVEGMGIDWMSSKHAISQAIPPAYTEFIGAQIMRALE